jgi:subtilase family serine protease
MRRGLVGGFLMCVVAAVCIVIVEAQQPDPARTNTYVVQLDGPVLESWKTALVEAGAELQEYVPQFAFRVRMTPAAAARVRRLDFVSTVSAIRVDQKLALQLRRDGALPYIVRLEPGSLTGDVEAALRLAGVQVLRRGGQLMIIADSTQLERLAEIDGVGTIENYPLRIKHNEFGGGVILGSALANASGFDGSTQTIAIADTGLGLGTASGAHNDIAPARVSSIFNWPGVADFCFETIANDGAQDVDSGHGTHVATAALGSGDATGAGRGTAPAGQLVFQAIENFAVPSLLCSLVYGLPDGYYLVGIPDDIGDLFNQAYQQNARVHSNSWGSEVAGAYSADSANADAFIWSHRDLTVTFSAGNSGTDGDADGVVDGTSINAPGTAKNVITVGASENDRQAHFECDAALTYTTCATQGGQNEIFTYGSAWPERYLANPLRDDPSAGNAEQMAAFSSRGPTSDGRIKPDVVAPGTWNLSGYSNMFQQQYDGSPNPLNGAYQYDGWGFPLDSLHKYMGGTSMSAPLVAGGAAVVRDFYQKSRGHQASAALVKAVLINSAVDLLDENNDGVLDNANPIPNIHEGWGRVDLGNATDASDVYFDEAASLSTGNSAMHSFEVTSPGVPLKVTLAWTDYPASTSAVTALVNDLDLTVTAPDGTIYRGNAFSGGWSAPGGAFDRLNNVENAYVFSAIPGMWTIEVSGYNVPMGPQSFALVIDTVPAAAGLPMVRVTVDDGTATEAGSTSGLLRFTRTGDAGSALEVAYSVSGTATSGSDYQPLSGFVTIPEGSLDAVVAITPIDDSLYELTELVVVAVDATAAYTVGSPSSGSVSIASDELPPDLIVYSLSIPANVAEGSTIAVQDTTRNQGPGIAPASKTAFYLSLNTTWDSSDEFLGERAVSALGVAVAETATTSIQLPETLTPGTYYVIAKADWNSAVDEQRETNNTRSDSAKAGPDLTVSTMTAPQTATPGESIDVTDTTKNLGAGAAGASTTSFFLSTNTTFDGGDVPLGSRSVGSVNGFGTDVATTSLTIPPITSGGTYYVLAQSDNAGAVVEYLETNNVRASGAVRIGADLALTQLTAPEDVGSGQAIDVNDTTANIGTAEAPPTLTRFYWSVNATLDASDLLIGTRPVGALDPGTFSAGTTPVTIPASATGSYYLFASADDPRELSEMSESNNTKKLKIDVGPDLVVGDVDTSGATEPGGSLSITDSTQNAGGGLAAATVTSFYLSINAAVDAADIFLGTRPVPALTAGQASVVTTSFAVPALTPVARYYVLAKSDHGAAVAEISETNNVKASSSIQVGPDLVVPALGAPSTVVRGTSFTITDTTRNDGGASVVTTTSYYLSVNSTLDASDPLLGSHSVSALPAGGAENGQATVVIPVGQAAGNYYIIAKADSGGVAAEITETNNVRSRAVKVNP